MDNETKIESNITETGQKVQPVAPEDESPQQINWRKFRQEREKERKDKIEAERRATEKEAEAIALKAAMEALVAKTESPRAHYETEESDDQKLERRVQEALRKERERNEVERKAREQREFPTQIAKNFQDFDKVCNTENLDYLEYHYPEVASAFKELPDSYNKWASVYGAVKKLVPQEANRDKARADANSLKPQSMSVAGKTEVGDGVPRNLDAKRKEDNWLRMQRVMRGG
jgi:hypothetical protein